MNLFGLSFLLFTLPLGAVLKYFLPIFWCSSISWKPFNCFTLFFTDVLGITQGVPSLKKPSYNISFLLRAILKYFWDHFRVYSSNFESCYLSYFMKFCADVFYITLTVSVLRTIWQHVFLCVGQYTVFWTYFGYILNELRHLKFTFDICMNILVLLLRSLN